MIRLQHMMVGTTIDDFASLAADRIVESIHVAIQAKGKCTIALTGGNTPRPVYDRLAHSNLAYRVDWDKVDFFFTDERCVPPDDEASNYRMVSETLLTDSPIPADRVHRITAENPDHDHAAAEYEKILPRRLDILLLGIGADAHTASLFPGSSAVNETQRRVAAVETPAEPSWRITITPPVIADATELFVLVTGEEKAEAVSIAALEPRDPQRYPAQLAIKGTWIMDEAAAGTLQQVQSTGTLK